jgi:chromatin assembly factor 1 subunit B
LTDLEAHAKPVNCVRFSPDGTMLASASVDGTIIIWKFDGLQRRWMQFTQLLIHTSDVVDLCWSPNSQFLFSGSMDDTAIMWDVSATGSAKVHKRFSDHQQYVQGVAWDPLDQVLVSVSSDRSIYTYKPKNGVRIFCRIFARLSRAQQAKCCSNEPKEFDKKQVTHRSFERSLERSESEASGVGGVDDGDNVDIAIAEEGDHDAPTRRMGHHQLFLSDLQNGSQFRRTSWAADGSFFVVPSGQLKRPDTDKISHCSYIFNRKFKPVAALPCGKKPSVVASCCPVLFKRTPGVAPKSTQMNQQHKIVWAIATCDSIFVYNSENPETPMLVASDLHYFSVTDLAWSHDGRWLIGSSRDGFCTIISFSAGELGEVVKKEVILPQNIPGDTAASPRVVIDNIEVLAAESRAIPAADHGKPTKDSAAAEAALSAEIINVLEPPSLEECAVRDAPPVSEPPKKKRIAPTLLAAPCVPAAHTAPLSVAESFGLESSPATIAAISLPPASAVTASAFACSPLLPAIPSAAAATPQSPPQLGCCTPETLDKASAPVAPSSSGRKRVQPTLLAMLGASSSVLPMQMHQQ